MQVNKTETAIDDLEVINFQFIICFQKYSIYLYANVGIIQRIFKRILAK
jgi:hypothetical protein